MKLSVLSRSLKAANESALGYKDALAKLISYSAQVKGYSLPDLAHGENWPGGKEAYAQAQEQWAETGSHLRAWALNVLGQTVTLPLFLIGSSKTVVVPMLTGALNDVEFLMRRPTDPAVKADLLETLGFLDRKYGEYSQMVDALIQALEDQRNRFEEDAAVMRQIAENAGKTKGVDQDKIADLRRDIQALQADITSRAAAIAGGSLATIAGLGIGGVAIGLAAATFGISLFLLIPAALIGAGGIYIIATNAIEIEKDKAEIARKSQTLTELEADVLLLQTMADTLTGFANQVAAMKEALGVVLAPWQATADYFHTSIPMIEKIAEGSTEDWQQVRDDLLAIREGWDQEIVRMEDIKLEGSMYPDAKLEIGMDEQQVKAALDASKPVSLVQYLAA